MLNAFFKAYENLILQGQQKNAQNQEKQKDTNNGDTTNKEQESTTIMNHTTPIPVISNNQASVSTPVDNQNNYYQSYVPQQSTNFHSNYWRLFAGFTPSWNSNMNNITVVKFNG